MSSIMNELQLQARRKLVATLELDHVSPILPNQSWKLWRFFFFNKKAKKSPDNQHCKWGEGRTCLAFQVFLNRIVVICYFVRSYTRGDFREVPAAWQTRAKSTKMNEKKTKERKAFFTASNLLQILTS